MCVLIYPVILPKFTEPNFIATAVSIIVAFLVVFLHRENIKRLLNGNESKLNLRTKGSKNEDIKKDEDEENQ